MYRVLPEAEWGRIADAGMPDASVALGKENFQLVVVEDKGRIVATMALWRVVHLEGFWIDPDYRGKAGTIRGLIRGVLSAAKKWSPKWLWACSDTEQMDAILQKLHGVRMPVRSFTVPLGDQ